jgi:iron(III) transport system ATP-binding protein
VTTSPADLVLTGVRKSFGPLEVLAGVDFRVPHGSFTALLGPSGSGKTTLLRILAGFERPSHGTVAVGDTIYDDAHHHVRPEARRVGYVSQDGSLFPHLTVKENVGFGVARSERKGLRVTELLDLVGLSNLGHRYPHELSGGQQQRVAVARALAIGPAIVLLDEPFAALDDQLRHGVRADVRRILRDLGATTILVTHDQDEALSTADHVAVLRDGRVAQYATPEELYLHPVDAALATLVGDSNFVDGVLRDHGVETSFGLLAIEGASPVPSGAAVTVLIRPEQFTFASSTDEPTGRCAVSETRYHGHDLMIRLAVTDAAVPTFVTARTLGDVPLALGTAVRLEVRGPVTVWPKDSPTTTAS